jgi:PAS domain S-box-containing protein
MSADAYDSLAQTMKQLPIDDLLRLIAEGTAGVTGEAFFQSLVRHMALALEMRYAFVAEFTSVKTRVRTLAFWNGDGFRNNFEYDLAGTPCEAVLAGETRCYPKEVRKLFSEDADLAEMRAESYLAVPLIASSGSVMGHLAAMDTKPMRNLPQDMTVFSIFAARARAELERLQAEAALQRAHDELELRVQLRTTDLAKANADLQAEISERKRYEAELKLRDRAIEASTVGIIITDARQTDHPIIYANPAFAQMTGYTSEELIGRNPYFLQGPETDPRAIEEIRRALREAQPCLITLRSYRQDGTPFWNELFISPVRDDQGNVTHFIGTHTDVTQIRRAEEERRELEIARQIQLSLLPGSPLQVDGAHVAGYCLPARHVGGDYFDYFCGSDTIDIIIADVSGHSVGAALVMAETRSCLKTEALCRLRTQHGKGTGEILAAVNTLLYEDLNRAELFITMFYMQYTRATRRLCYANAGHNYPLLLRAGDSACRELDAEGLVLGVKREVTFEEKSVVLRKGDLVLLYTDGITEAQNPEGEFFGAERLGKLVATQGSNRPEEIIDKIVSDLHAFWPSGSFADDVSMVVFKLT